MTRLDTILYNYCLLQRDAGGLDPLNSVGAAVTCQLFGLW